MESVILILPGNVSVEAIQTCVLEFASGTISTPLSIEVNGYRGYIRPIDDPELDGIFCDSGDAGFRGGSSVFAVDYRHDSVPLAVVRAVIGKFPGSLIDTDFGEVLPGEEFLTRFTDERIGG